MSNRIIAINGESWCRQLTGIERLAIEVTQYLDDLVSPGQMELVVPANAQNVPVLKNIRVVRLPQHAGFFPKWTQLYFQRYVLLHRRMSFDYTNTCPFFVPGIEFIHDIYQKLYPAEQYRKMTQYSAGCRSFGMYHFSLQSAVFQPARILHG